MLVCVSLHTFARETAGAARTRLSLRPLFSGGPNEQAKPRAKPAARMQGVSSVIASAAKQSIAQDKESWIASLRSQ
jgi:hypothetical protein